MKRTIPWSSDIGMSDRSPERYVEYFGPECMAGLTEEDRVLEIGPGSSESFARSIRRTTGASVVTVGPHFAAEHDRQTSRDHDAVEGMAPQRVAARAEALPFPDGYFSRIVALFSVPFYSKDKQSMHREFAEMIRVLKSGGTAYVHPLAPLSEVRWFKETFSGTVEVVSADSSNTLIFKKV